MVACLALSLSYGWKSVERLAFSRPTTTLAWFASSPVYFLLPFLQLLAFALLSAYFLGRAGRRTMTFVLLLLALLCLVTLQQSWEQVSGLVADIGAGEPFFLEPSRHLYMLSDDGNLFLFLAVLLLAFRARGVRVPKAVAPPQAPAVPGGTAP